MTRYTIWGILLAGLPGSGIEHFLGDRFTRYENHPGGQGYVRFFEETDQEFDLYGIEAPAEHDFLYEVASEGQPGAMILVSSDRAGTWADSLYLITVLRSCLPCVVVNTGRTDPAAMLSALNLPPDEVLISCDLHDPSSRKAAILAAIRHTPELAQIDGLSEKFDKTY